MRYGFLIIGLLGFTNCNSKKVAPPPNLIPEDQMINLLIDIRSLEGAYSVKYREVDTSKQKIGTYYQSIFQEQGVTTEQFISSYSYYTQGEKMLGIENSVMEALSQVQAELESNK